MNKQDKEDKALWFLYNRDNKKATEPSAQFPLSEPLLSAYIDNRLNEQDRQKVEQRLAWDQDALDSVLIIKESMHADIEKVPSHIMENLKEIIPEQDKPTLLQGIIATLSLNERNFNLAMATSFSIVFIVGFQLGLSTYKNSLMVDDILFDELLATDNIATNSATTNNTGVKN